MDIVKNWFRWFLLPSEAKELYRKRIQFDQIKSSPFQIRSEISFSSEPKVIVEQEIVNKLKSILNWEGNKNIVKPFQENDEVENGKVNGGKPKVDTPVGKKFPEKAKEKEAKSKENGAADCTGDVCIPCLMPRPNKVRKIEQNENTEIEKKKRKMIHPPKAMLRVSFPRTIFQP